MTLCLEDKALFLLSEGEASEPQRSHLQSCPACIHRYEEIQQDLRLIVQTLEQEPPEARVVEPSAPIFYRSLALAAGVLLAVAIMWGESRLWRSRPSSEPMVNGEVSRFLEQVAKAIDDGTMTETGTPYSDLDLASLQAALGEDCFDECRRLFENAFSAKNTNPNPADRSLVTAQGREIDSTMPRMVSDNE